MAGFAALGTDRTGSTGFVVGGAAIPASGSVLGADHDLGDYAVLTGRGGWGHSGELFRATRARIRL